MYRQSSINNSQRESLNKYESTPLSAESSFSHLSVRLCDMVVLSGQVVFDWTTFLSLMWMFWTFHSLFLNHTIVTSTVNLTTDLICLDLFSQWLIILQESVRTKWPFSWNITLASFVHIILLVKAFFRLETNATTNGQHYLYSYLYHDWCGARVLLV